MNDWERIVKKDRESRDLDYKAPCSWDPKHKRELCCGLVKDILAMANSLGGWIVIGVEEIEEGWDYKGLTKEQSSSFETTKINQFVQNYADPPINTEVIKKQVDEKLFVIICVPRFPDTPHICQKDFSGALKDRTIYVRTANNESAPLKSSEDFRLIIETAIRNRSNQLLTSFRTILSHGVPKSEPADESKYKLQIDEGIRRCNELNPHKGKSFGYRETYFFPARFEKERFDIRILREMANNASISFRGWPFIFISDSRPDFTYTISDGLETFIDEESEITGPDNLHFWQLKQSGLLYTKEILWEDTLLRHRGFDRMLDFDCFSKLTAEAIYCLVKLYEDRIDEDEEIVFSFKLTGLSDRPLGTSNPARFPLDNNICKIDEITYKSTRLLLDWKTGFIDHALDICNYVFQRINWSYPSLGESRKLIEEILNQRPL